MKDLLRHNIIKHKRPIKYLIAGGLAAFVDLSLLYFFTDILGIWYLFSACLAFVVAFFVSFFLQKFWTFRDNDKERMYKQMAVYLFVALVNFMINAVFMFMLVDGFKIWYMLAQVVTSGLIACESYLVYKFFIFNQTAKPTGDKMKVLIATGIYPPDIGGPAAMLEALVKSLKEQGFLIKIITYAEGGEAGETESGSVYKINRNQIKFFAYLNYFYRLWRLALWADVMYVTDIYSVGYFAYLLNKLAGKKYIIRFAGDSAWETAVASGVTADYIVDFQEKKYNFKIEKLKARRKKILLGADKVIAVSNFMSTIAQAIGVKSEKIKIIYNSVDFLAAVESGDKAAAIRKRLGAEKIIMTACRLTPWKGVDGIIKILPEVKNKFGKVKLAVLGEGGELPKLKQLAEKLGVAGEVEFLGKIEHKQILNYYKAADLFILNTNYEGLSHTLLEVMKAGVPIITTEVGGNPEVIANGQEGILVKYNNLAELSAAVFKIFNDYAFTRTLVENSKEKLKIFSWKKTIEQTAEVLKKAVWLKYY